MQIDSDEARMSGCLAALEVPEAPWVDAGEFYVLLSGQVLVPNLPPSPGILRIDKIIGDGGGGVAVALSEHDSMRAEEPTWNEPEMAASLIAGEQSVVYFLDAADWPYESPDLRTESDRKAIIQHIEEQAVGSGYWFLQSVDGQNVLVMDA